MDSKEKLLDAMAELLWERGYAATSPREVMDAAGVGQGSMYHHFAGKHDLAVQAMKLSIARALATNAPLTGAGAPIDRLRAHLLTPRPGTKGCRVGRMTQDPEVLADPELFALVSEAFDEIHQVWADTFREAIAAGQLPSHIDPDDLASAMQAVLQGGYVLSRAKGEQEPMDAAVRGAAALLDAAATCARGPENEPEPRRGDAHRHDAHHHMDVPELRGHKDQHTTMKESA